MSYSSSLTDPLGVHVMPGGGGKEDGVYRLIRWCLCHLGKQMYLIPPTSYSTAAGTTGPMKESVISVISLSHLRALAGVTASSLGNMSPMMELIDPSARPSSSDLVMSPIKRTFASLDSLLNVGDPQMLGLMVLILLT